MYDGIFGNIEHNSWTLTISPYLDAKIWPMTYDLWQYDCYKGGEKADWIDWPEMYTNLLRLHARLLKYSVFPFWDF